MYFIDCRGRAGREYIWLEVRTYRPSAEFHYLTVVVLSLSDGVKTRSWHHCLRIRAHFSRAMYVFPALSLDEYGPHTGLFFPSPRNYARGRIMKLRIELVVAWLFIQTEQRRFNSRRHIPHMKIRCAERYYPELGSGDPRKRYLTLQMRNCVSHKSVVEILVLTLTEDASVGEQATSSPGTGFSWHTSWCP